MGKFINKQYKETVDNLTLSSKTFLNNPFYKFNDKKPTKVRYYNTNLDKTTLDQGSKLIQSEVGEESPKRFNVIDDLFLFGLPKIELNLDNGEFGLESEEISGECFILPNTIEPYPEDFFEIPYMFDGPWLFKVTAVNRDTLGTGANVFRINYKLEKTTNDEIKENIVDEFVAIDVQEGTNFKTIIQKKKYFEAVDLDNLATRLKEYYINLFFNEPTQTFIYKYYESNMYDPFLIEFIIRNGIVENNGSEFIYVQHQTPLNPSFGIDYDRTFYRAFELSDKQRLLSSENVSQADVIRSMITVFHSRFEDYFALNYKPIRGIAPGAMNPRNYIEVFPSDIVYAINDNEDLIEDDKLYQNIFIKFFNNEDLTTNDIENIKNMNFDTSKNMFYMIPLVIFVLEFYTKKLLS